MVLGFFGTPCITWTIKLEQFSNPKSITSYTGIGMLISSGCYVNYRVAVFIHPA
jgi:hypothetical protein